MINVLVMAPCEENQKQMLENSSNVFSFTYTNKDDPDLQSKIDKAEIIVGQPRKQYLKNVPNLKLIQMTMAGTDKYTMHEGFPEHVTLCNASGAFGHIISQYVIGGILNICHNFHRYRDNQRNNLWKDLGCEMNLTGKRALVIGTGNIGSNVAERLSHFGVEIVGIRRKVSDVPSPFKEMHTLDELNEQLPLADIVIGCIPNSDYTYHLFDKEKFGLMKEGSIFINVGRGSFTVQQDLAEALNSGHLRGAVIDVMAPEPLPADNPLWSVENLVITPHISGSSFGHLPEITNKIYEIAADNLKSYAEGRPLKNVIDISSFRK